MKKPLRIVLIALCLLAIAAVAFFCHRNKKTAFDGSAKDTTSAVLIGGWKTITGGFAEEIDFRIDDGKNVFAYYQTDSESGITREVEECDWSYENAILQINCLHSGMHDSFDRVSVSDTSLTLSSTTSDSDSGTYERIPKQPSITTKQSMTNDEAIALVQKVPEVQKWMALFTNPDGTSPRTGGKPSFSILKDEQDSYVVWVFEDTPTHEVTFGKYNVNKTSGKITKEE